MEDSHQAMKPKPKPEITPRKAIPAVPSLVKTQLGEMGGAPNVEPRMRKMPLAQGGGKKSVVEVSEQPPRKRRVLPTDSSPEGAEKLDWMSVTSMGQVLNMQALVRFWIRFSECN